MADVLLLCVHADAQRAVVLAEELEIAGFSVEGASAGQSALDACSAALLVWTKDSAESGLFHDAAQLAARSGKVIVANFTGAAHPWGRAANIDMARWDGDPESVAVDLLINAVMRRTARKRRPANDFASCYMAMRAAHGAGDAEEDHAAPPAERPAAPVIELSAASKSDPFAQEAWLFGAPPPTRHVQWRGRAALSAVVAAAVMLAGSFLNAPSPAETFAASAYAEPLAAPAPALDQAISFEDALATTPLDLTPTEAPVSEPRFGREPAAAPAETAPRPVRRTVAQAAPAAAPVALALPARAAPRLTPIDAVVTQPAPRAQPRRTDADWLNQREAERLRALYATQDAPAI